MLSLRAALSFERVWRAPLVHLLAAAMAGGPLWWLAHLVLSTGLGTRRRTTASNPRSYVGLRHLWPLGRPTDIRLSAWPLRSHSTAPDASMAHGFLASADGSLLLVYRRLACGGYWHW